MKIHLRLDEVTPEHIRETVFIDGQNCGQLTLGHGQYQLLGTALLLGKKQMLGRLELEYDPIAHDADGNFKMPTNR